MKTFTELEAWKAGHIMVAEIYRHTQSFPKDERYGLISQMRRCAVSITSNIAEGFGRQSFKEKVQFYSIALGSTAELQNQCLIAREVGYLTPIVHQKLSIDLTYIHKLINGLIRSSKSRIPLNP